MVWGEKAGGKRNQRKRIKSREKGSDDSDEDYVISEQETDASDDVLEDLDGSALEDGLDNFDEDEVEVEAKDLEEEVEEEDYEEENYPRKSISRPRSSRGKKANRKSPQNGLVSKKHGLDNLEVEDEEDEEEENKDKEDPRKPSTRPRSSRGRKANKQSLEKNVTVSRKYDIDNHDEAEVELEEEEEEKDYKEEEVDSRKSQSRSRSSCGRQTDEKSLQKNRFPKEDDDDDEEYVVNDEDDDDDDDDDEFTPEEEDDDDCLEDEENSTEEKGTRNEIGTRKSSFKGKASQRSGRKKKRSKISRKASKNRGTKQIMLRKKAKLENGIAGEDSSYFLDEDAQWRRTGRKNTGRRKRRFVASSDLDFMTSGSSDCEYTISEEEREQVEANDFCGTLVPCTRKSSTSKRSVRRGGLSLRSSTSCNRAGEGDNTANQPKSTGTKGKEKVEEPNVMKQVCGICLSEEDKRKVRGTLDCCSHYFCFNCIKEWSKVESRCPLCKQRFHTIIKPARCNAGIDLREIVLQVPERDQVYQPTEEEIRDYLDPYESVICTECQLGGDDDLMLLCDLCDSPAHTFCVGLGREVPEGSWYCDGCRPGALGSLGAQSLDHLPNNQRTSSNLSNWTMPSAGLTEGFDLNAPPSIQVLNLPSPRFPLGFSQTLSPLSGAQASTLSGRRMIHRHIQLRNGRSPRTDGSSTSIFLIEPQPYPVDQGRLVTLQPTGMETRAPNISSSSGLPQEIPFPALQRSDVPVFTAPSTSGRLLLNGCAGMNLISVPDQNHQSSSRLSISSDGGRAPPTLRGGAPPTLREQSYPYRAEEQLHTMIKMHLQSLSVGNDLGYGDFNDIERSSIQTILAACGIRQRGCEASAIPPSLVCSHVDGTRNGQTSLMKGTCSSCFDVFVREVVRDNLKAKLQPHWLSLGL